MFYYIKKNPGVTGALGKPSHFHREKDRKEGRENLFNVRCQLGLQDPKLACYFITL